uniref:Reverse transcriptase domain-containing protein n=1 Tax=Clytia hemisphaerica TaxID=252671 RepID=A0A7M6DPV8_9CNID
MARTVGKGCFMSKVDIRHAFRLCPVHPEDRSLLGYLWQERYFVDVCLPFGNRSSPCIFNSFADALQWILVHRFSLSALTHYLDDFFLCCPLRDQAEYEMLLIQSVFGSIGVPVAEDKLEGPSQVLSYLGIEIDSVTFTIRLPANKLASLRDLVGSWIDKRKCVKRDLLSLIGSLSFARKVIKPGRIFLRRLIDLSTTVSKLHHHIDIPFSVRLDLCMWSEFLSSWNGCSILPDPPVSSVSLSLSSDASFKGLRVFFFKANGFLILGLTICQVLLTLLCLNSLLFMLHFQPLASPWSTSRLFSTPTTSQLSPSGLLVLPRINKLWVSCANFSSLLPG